MIGIVYNAAYEPSALPDQAIYTWYRQDDEAQTVILVVQPVPARRPGTVKRKTLGELFPELFK